jgi:signal transduction histidine kinase
VQCYAGQINQVFLNILTNAIDALEDYNSQPSFYGSADAPNVANASLSPSLSPSLSLTPEEIQQNRRTIRIRTEVSNSDFNGLSKGNQQWVTIRIADNGPGMTQAVKQRIFDPFFTTKPVGQGTGLGLSISYQIVVDKHGGQLWCDSAPGQGTEFFIEIPVFYKHESA